MRVRLLGTDDMGADFGARCASPKPAVAGIESVPAASGCAIDGAVP